MQWTVIFHTEFKAWLYEQEEGVQDAIFAILGVLEREGPQLGRPYVDTLEGSRYSNMKELRVQHKGEPWRIIFAFDPERQAVVLLGGNKVGNARWYKENIPIAQRRFAEHLNELEEARKKKEEEEKKR